MPNDTETTHYYVRGTNPTNNEQVAFECVGLGVAAPFLSETLGTHLPDFIHKRTFTPAANANGAGSISPSTLEESNVDIASEFTKLITAQNVYSANSKVITTSNQMIQSLLDMMR